MAEFRRKIGQMTIRARCTAGLAAQADWLLGVVGSFEHQGKGLADGVIVQIGWSFVRLRKDGDDLALCEPDFDGNPFQDFRDDVTCTLAVLERQNQVLSKMGVQRAALRYDEKIVALKGCLSDPRIYAERQKPREGDSGWYIGPAKKDSAQPVAKDLEARWVFELNKIRPGLLDIMALPEGYLVVFNNDEIEAIVDSNNRNAWKLNNEISV